MNGHPCPITCAETQEVRDEADDAFQVQGADQGHRKLPGRNDTSQVAKNVHLTQVERKRRSSRKAELPRIEQTKQLDVSQSRKRMKKIWTH